MIAAIASTPPPNSARERVLEAATNLFATHGFQAIGLRDLASYLGIHAGSLYHHIENKQCLLFELIESALNDLLTDTKRRMRGANTPRERLWRFIKTFVAFTLSEQQRLVLVTREFVNLSEEHQYQANQLKDAYWSLLSTIIVDELRSKGDPDPQVCLITHAVIGMLHGQSQWNDLDVTEHHLAEMLTDCVMCIIERS